MLQVKMDTPLQSLESAHKTWNLRACLRRTVSKCAAQIPARIGAVRQQLPQHRLGNIDLAVLALEGLHASGHDLQLAAAVRQ